MNKRALIRPLVMIGLGIVFYWVFFGGTGKPSTNTEQPIASVSEQALMHKEYPDVPEKNRFVRQTGRQIIDRFTEGTGVIFLGFKECPWCQKTAPLLNSAAESENMTIYYLDIRQEHENASSEYNEIVSILSPYLPKNQAGVATISTPDISFVRNGKIVWRNEMEATTPAERTPDTYWTTDRQKRAITRFREKMRDIKS